MVKPLRLQKYIADCGICSRRNAESLIQAGRVKVNSTIANLGQKVTSADQIYIDNKLISATKNEPETYLVYKPINYTSSTKDMHADLLVTDLVPSTSRLYPVGRLDKNSEGLLLLTNDGELANKATHPKYVLLKVYEVHIIPNFRKSDIRMLEEGIQDGDDFLTLDKIVLLAHNKIEITLHHGKKRHIRRMLAKCHYHVEKLIRTKIGSCTLASLNEKSYRRLTAQEVQELKKAQP